MRRYMREVIAQKTAYEMCVRDWSSDVCSSDLWIDAGWYGNSTKCDDAYTGDWGRWTGDWEIGRASCRERV